MLLKSLKQNKTKVVKSSPAPSLSLPGIPLCRRSPEVYVGDQVHLWHTVQEQAACGCLVSSFVFRLRKSPSTTLLSNPARKHWNRASLLGVHLSLSWSSFLESQRCQDNTQSVHYSSCDIQHKYTHSHTSTVTLVCWRQLWFHGCHCNADRPARRPAITPGPTLCSLQFCFSTK